MEYFIESVSLEELIVEAYKRLNEIWGVEWYKSEEFYDKIHVKHQDGSIFKVRHCFYRLGRVHGDNVFIVFSEHNGIFSFAECDICFFKVKKDKKVITVFKETE